MSDYKQAQEYKTENWSKREKAGVNTNLLKAFLAGVSVRTITKKSGISTPEVEEIIRDELLGVTDRKPEITKQLIDFYERIGEWEKYKVPEGGLKDWLAWKWAFRIEGDD